MTEQQWQQADPPRGRLRWVLAAAVGVVAVALLARVEPDDNALEIDTEAVTPPPDDDAPLTPTPDAEPTAQPDGAAPAGGAWQELALAEDLGERSGAPLVWGADRAFVWGGERPAAELTAGARRSFFNTGVAFDLADGAAADLPHVPIEPRTGHVAVWAGEALFVWGGVGVASYLMDGARYSPAADAWTTVAPSPLAPRGYATAVWTGAEVLVVGGVDNAGARVDGAAYNPAADAWRPLADAPRPLAPYEALGADAAVWADGRLVVPAPPAPGEGELELLTYDPGADSWAALPAPPIAYQQPTEVALVADDGGRLLAVAKGQRQRPLVWQLDEGDWRELPPPPGRAAWPAHWQPGALATWTDHGLAVVAGGDHGLLLDPAAGRWTDLPPAPLPELTIAQVAWTDEGLLVWPHPLRSPGPQASPTEGVTEPALWAPEGG